MTWIQIVQNWMTFLGILVLAVPVWSLNFRKKSLHQIEEQVDEREQEGDTSVVDGIAKILKKHREASVGKWRRRDEICLIVGYVLLLGSSAWRLVA